MSENLVGDSGEDKELAKVIPFPVKRAVGAKALDFSESFARLSGRPASSPVFDPIGSARDRGNFALARKFQARRNKIANNATRYPALPSSVHLDL